MSESNILIIIEHYKELCQFENATGKVAVFSRVASELSRYSPKPNAWTWRYIAGIVSGRMKAGKYIVEAIEKLSNEIAGEPKLVPVPACPVPGCEEAYVHLHGKQTYDPAVQVVKPTPKTGQKRHRIAIHKQDMRSASVSITNNIATYRVRELHTILTEYLEWADPENNPAPVQHGQSGAGEGA